MIFRFVSSDKRETSYTITSVQVAWLLVGTLNQKKIELLQRAGVLGISTNYVPRTANISLEKLFNPSSTVSSFLRLG
jgi:hypothetical protein